MPCQKDCLIDYLRFYVPLKIFSFIWRRHHCRWRAAKFRPILGAQGLWAWRDLFCATLAVIQDLSFSGIIRRTAPFSRLLRHTRGCRESILTLVLTGLEGIYMWNIKALAPTNQKLWPRLQFLKMSHSKVRGSRSWCQMKGHVRKNTHVKYESPSTYQTKVITKVKVLLTGRQTDC
jgi:hypothetical protein